MTRKIGYQNKKWLLYFGTDGTTVEHQILMIDITYCDHNRRCELPVSGQVFESSDHWESLEAFNAAMAAADDWLELEYGTAYPDNRKSWTQAPDKEDRPHLCECL